MEVAITDSELELLQKLRVVHQVESVEHVEVGLGNECVFRVVIVLFRFKNCGEITGRKVDFLFFG